VRCLRHQPYSARDWEIELTSRCECVEIKTEDDLLPPGAPVGTIGTDLDQATGLERLEILGKMEGVDIFDMKPLEATRKGMHLHSPHLFVPTQERDELQIVPQITASRRLGAGARNEWKRLILQISTLGTLKDPILVKSFGDEQYVGCNGIPADTHHQLWMVLSRERPIERCSECGNVMKMEYVGPAEDPHAHDHGHGHDEHGTLAS